MRLNAVAKYKNSIPKENSKTQIEKREKAKDNYTPKICCKKCKATTKTLYKIKDNYYCIDCK